MQIVSMTGLSYPAVRATLDRVSKGQPLAELYVPDWVAAQEEFLAAKPKQEQ